MAWNGGSNKSLRIIRKRGHLVLRVFFLITVCFQILVVSDVIATVIFI